MMPVKAGPSLTQAVMQIALHDHPDLLVMSDDIYNRLVFNCDLAPHILLGNPDLKDQVIVVNGVSISECYSYYGTILAESLSII